MSCHVVPLANSGRALALQRHPMLIAPAFVLMSAFCGILWNFVLGHLMCSMLTTGSPV